MRYELLEICAPAQVAQLRGDIESLTLTLTLTISIDRKTEQTGTVFLYNAMRRLLSCQNSCKNEDILYLRSAHFMRKRNYMRHFSE